MKAGYKTLVSVQPEKSPFYNGEVRVEINVSIPEPLAEALREKIPHGFGEEEAKGLLKKIAEMLK